MDNLSKTAQTVEIPLTKIAVDTDNSFAELQFLLFSGYDRVRWNISTSEACPLCKEIADAVNGESGEGISLAAFLGMQAKPKMQADEQGNLTPVLNENGEPEYEYSKVVEIYKDAPIYNWSHVGCLCTLTVFKSANSSDSVIVTHNG